MIPVLNLTRVPQVFGHHYLRPGEWTEVPRALARQLATNPDYRIDSNDLAEDFLFLEDGGHIFLGWSSPFHYCDGYGSVAQEIARTLIESGVNLSIYTRDYDPGKPQFGGIPLDQWSERAFVPKAIVECLRRPQQPECCYGINMTWPRDIHHHPFLRGIGLTMFETTTPPAAWSIEMNKCRRIIVPCRQNKEAFERQGVTTPIDVVCLGVDPDKWPVPELKRTEYRPYFTFLMAAGLTHRKNPVGAARAFVAAFPRAQYPDVRFVLKTRGEQTSGGFWDWNKRLPSDDRIRFVAEESTPAQMVQWMHDADAFVFPSRGEGFGLTPLQAMSTGLPVIVSNNSGMSEYCDPRYNYPVSCFETKVPHVSKGGYPPDWGDVGNWWEPNFDELVARYRQVYEKRESARKTGLAAAKWVREQWTVKRTCESLLRVVMNDAGGA